MRPLYSRAETQAPWRIIYVLLVVPARPPRCSGSRAPVWAPALARVGMGTAFLACPCMQGPPCQQPLPGLLEAREEGSLTLKRACCSPRWGSPVSCMELNSQEARASPQLQGQPSEISHPLPHLPGETEAREARAGLPSGTHVQNWAPFPPSAPVPPRAQRGAGWMRWKGRPAGQGSTVQTWPRGTCVPSTVMGETEQD